MLKAIKEPNLFQIFSYYMYLPITPTSYSHGQWFICDHQLFVMKMPTENNHFFYTEARNLH